jgi:MFS family permease
VSDTPISSSGARSAVSLLGLTQIVGYGTSYYSFGLLADPICAEFGWSKPFYFGVFSIGLAASGLCASTFGKSFDRLGAARVMVLGSLLCSFALAVLSQSSSAVMFIITMIALQVASDLVLYDAAFTALVQISPERGARRITYLTLIAGFASTLFWPLTDYLSTSFGWRETLLVFAALQIALCLPAHWYLWQQSRLAKRIAPDETQRPKVVIGDIPRERQGFVLAIVSIGFMLSSIALSAVLAAMVPMLQQLGYGTQALAVAVLFGPAQVIVRFTNMIFGAQRHPLVITILALSFLPVGLVVAVIFTPSVGAAVAAVILIGMCSGLKSIVQGALPLKFFGSEGYGARLGIMASFRLVAAASAPFGYAVVETAWGAEIAFLILAAIASAGVACFVYLKVVLARTVS